MTKNLVFPQEPFIFRYIAFEYNEAETVTDLIELSFKWLRVIDTTSNQVKKQAFKTAYNSLYEELKEIV